MTNFWLFPFGLIGYWFAVGIVELIRTSRSPAINDNNKPARA